MQLFWILIFGVALYAAIVLIMSSRVSERDMVSLRLKDIQNMSTLGAAPDRDPLRSLRQRLINPLFKRVANMVGTVIPTNPKQRAQLSMQLRASGSTLDPDQYVGRIASFMILGGVCMGLLSGLVMRSDVAHIVLYVLVGVFGVFVVARFSLTSKVTARKDDIEANMPDALDLLSTSVSAGLGFDQALLHVVAHCEGPLIDEFAMIEKEIALGRTRSEALQSLADRCEVEALTTFVNALQQADRLGIPIANVLATQAEAIRRYRKQRVEEKAAKLPVKILLPLVGFIFPALLVVLLGPAAVSIVGALA